ncbi:hypothetical protein [Mycobacterium phage WXIN]|nr:hypothetical protein [Mycobacterium phage WXIN]
MSEIQTVAIAGPVQELVKDWVDDILCPDIEWSELHEQLGEYITDWDELSDGLRDQIAAAVDEQVRALLKVAHAHLMALGKL